MKFSVFQATHPGGRARNEDRLGYTYTRQAVLLVLADGMGGHPDGDQAAEIAVRTFVQAFVDVARPKVPDPATFLEDTLLRASQAIVDFARARQAKEHPRTTAVAAVVQDGRLTAVHSGDSRLYWVRRGRLLTRTRDHSYHDRPGLFGELPAHLNRSVLFTCLGSETPPMFDLLGPLSLEHGDRILLCSDGLWGVMSDDDVAAGLYGQPLADAVAHLSESALRLGGRHGDNVTLIGLEWQADDNFPSTQVLESQQPPSVPVRSNFGVNAVDGVVASELDDLEIERTIAEINDAIRRTRRVPAASPGPTGPGRRT
ncbi:MAG: serine/threonine-protein phosphatase [Tepidimonas taiwanensis]|nr:serine/threonine-protein phosphatase [Tepidimonas taiwanensis]